MKKLLIIVLLVVFTFPTFAGTATPSRENKKDSLSIKDQGFNFFLGGGCYFASKYNAQYYDGSILNENNLGYLFSNKYYYDEIINLFKNTYPYIGDSVRLGGPMGNTSYKVAMMINLGVKYRLSENWGIQLSYSFARLISNGQFRVNYSAIPSISQPGYIDNQYVVGKEDRSLFDFAATYLFSTKSIVKPFLEAGLQFNFIRVKSMDAIFYDDNRNKLKSYSILDTHQQYVPGIQSDGTVYKYGGPGFGFSAVAGIKICFNQLISLDPSFYFSASKFGLEGYKDFSYNFGIILRIVFSDQKP